MNRSIKMVQLAAGKNRANPCQNIPRNALAGLYFIEKDVMVYGIKSCTSSKELRSMEETWSMD